MTSGLHTLQCPRRLRSPQGVSFVYRVPWPPVAMGFQLTVTTQLQGAKCSRPLGRCENSRGPASCKDPPECQGGNGTCLTWTVGGDFSTRGRGTGPAVCSLERRAGRTAGR